MARSKSKVTKKNKLKKLKEIPTSTPMSSRASSQHSLSRKSLDLSLQLQSLPATKNQTTGLAGCSKTSQNNSDDSSTFNSISGSSSGSHFSSCSSSSTSRSKKRSSSTGRSTPHSKTPVRSSTAGTSRSKTPARSSSDGTEIRRRYRPGVKALKEIRTYQHSTNLLIPRSPFYKVVRELLQNEQDNRPSLRSELRIQRLALEALQEACEIALTQFFSDAWYCTLHAKRVTLFVKDMEMVRRIRGKQDPFNA